LAAYAFSSVELGEDLYGREVAFAITVDEVEVNSEDEEVLEVTPIATTTPAATGMVVEEAPTLNDPMSSNDEASMTSVQDESESSDDETFYSVEDNLSTDGTLHSFSEDEEDCKVERKAAGTKDCPVDLTKFVPCETIDLTKSSSFEEMPPPSSQYAKMPSDNDDRLFSSDSDVSVSYVKTYKGPSDSEKELTANIKKIRKASKPSYPWKLVLYQMDTKPVLPPGFVSI
jgi:hypothetical protein